MTKVSDSEDSMDSSVGLSSSNPHHPASSQLQHLEPSMSTSVEPVEHDWRLHEGLGKRGIGRSVPVDGESP